MTAPPNEQPLMLAELDQLSAGIADNDPDAVMKARQMLALTARDASPALLRFVMDAIIVASEEPA